MSENNIWKYAAKNKLTFKTNKGILKTEDLFDLNVESLDSLYASLKKSEKNSQEFTLLKEKRTDDVNLEMSIAIVEEIVKDKLDAKEAAEKAKATEARNMKIQEIIDRKQDAELENKSIDELKAMLQ